MPFAFSSFVFSDPMQLFEMYDGEDRLVLDHRALGAAILDCEGRVVAVASNFFTQTIQSPLLREGNPILCRYQFKF